MGNLAGEIQMPLDYQDIPKASQFQSKGTAEYGSVG